MKILITGVAGFIGSNLAEFLLERDFEIVGIDNFNSFYDPKIKEFNIAPFKNNPNFKLYRVDILDVKALEAVFTTEKNLESLVHLAAWPNVTRSFEQPREYVRNNIEATVNLLEMCKKYGPKNFIFTSTSSVYGDNATPFTETMNTDKPLAPYPATKKAGEVLIYPYSKQFGINSTILRIFNPNGKKLRPDLAIPKLVKSCLYGYEFPLYWHNDAIVTTGRDYCFIDHICEAIEKVILNPFAYEIFNLGNSAPITLDKLISAVENATGKKANLVNKPNRNGEMQVTYANIDKARATLGYNPTTSIDQIAVKYVEWFTQQEEWYKKLTHI